MLVATETGKQLLLDADIDLSGAALSLSILRPDGSSVIRTGITAASVNTQFDGRTYLANRHALYALQANDIPIPGRYRMRLLATTGGRELRSAEQVVVVSE